MSEKQASGYATVNGIEMYWESHGESGRPLVAVHGGFGSAGMLTGLLRGLSERRRVIAVELQGHGHTRDIDRPFTWEAFGDDVAALVDHLGLGRADLLGFSLGAGACLRAAIQHPGVVRSLAVVSFPIRRDGWFPEIRAAFDQMSQAGFEYMQHSPMYAEYSQIAPDPSAFSTLMDKMGELNRLPFDWTNDVETLPDRTMLVYGDADSIPLAHIAEFYGMLGGGIADANWDGSGRPSARLAVLPGLTHYDIFGSPQLLEVVDAFLALPDTD